MINVSNAFKQELYSGHRNYLEYIDITLKDGTELNLTNRDLWQGGITIEDKVSESNRFEIGGAYDMDASFSIENIDDRFSGYDFDGAVAVAYIGLNLPDGKAEKIRKGTFTVNNPKYNASVITIPCLGNMQKFDRPYTESKLAYPVSITDIVRDACETCGVELQTPGIPHGNFVVQSRPSDEALTFRDIISWAAQIAGCFARCDVYGRLELKWYNQEILEKHGYDGGVFDKENPSQYATGDALDGGNFNPWDLGVVADGGSFQDMEEMHHIYSHYSAPDISVDDVVITGIRVVEKVEDENNSSATATYLSGKEGYVVEISGNGLIQGGSGQQVSNWLGEQLIGFRFRRATVSHASDPTIEAGDVGIVTNRKQETYPIIISSTRFSTGGKQVTESSAATPAKNSSRRFSADTKNYVEYRKSIERERTSREKAEADLKKRIDDSPGLFTTEKEQPDGGKVFYMHDKPSLEESSIVWKMTAEAWGVSTNGGKSYNAGMTVDGETIVRILTTVGINAEWINAGKISFDYAEGGTLKLGGVNNAHGTLEVLDEKGVKIGSWDNREISICGGSFHVWGVIQMNDSEHSIDVIINNGMEYRLNGEQTFKISSLWPKDKQPMVGFGIGDQCHGLAFGVPSANIENALTIKAMMNNGYNPGGLTQRHIFYEDLYCSGRMTSWQMQVGNSGVYFGEGGKYISDHCILVNDGDFFVRGSLGCSGTKNRIVDTLNFGSVAMNAVESTEAYFSDFGSGTIGENGEIAIFFDPVFADTIDLDSEYQVFLTRTSRKMAEWVDKQHGYFIVHGDPGATFDWMATCKQKDYSAMRMESISVEELPQENKENKEMEVII